MILLLTLIINTKEHLALQIFLILLDLGLGLPGYLGPSVGMLISQLKSTSEGFLGLNPKLAAICVTHKWS
jgi:hypothetical protein